MTKINEQLLATNLAYLTTFTVLKLKSPAEMHINNDTTLNYKVEIQKIFDEYFEIYMDHIRVATIN